MPSQDKRQLSKPIREIRTIRPRSIGSVTEKERERFQSHRIEYPVIALVWRFVTVARGLLILTACTVISTIMNYLRTGYLHTKEVVFLTDTKAVTIADDYISYLAGAAIILGLGITFTIVIRIDYHLELLQAQCVERGIACESFLNLNNGIFRRADTHKFYLQMPFHLARIVLVIVWLGWVIFILSIGR